MTHAENRVAERLAGVVTKMDQIALERYARANKVGKFYVLLRKFDRPIAIDEDGYAGGNGTGIRGDGLVGVIKDGNVVTFMVSWTKDRNYFSDAPMLTN